MVKLAVDKVYGGAIVYLSASDSSENMVNIHDKGRQIQQSYYAGKMLNRRSHGQSPNWSPWSWNPVQAGNFDGDKSIILAFEKAVDGSALYTKCRPRLWDMDEELAQCYFSQTIQFEKDLPNVIRVTNTIECFRDPNDIWGPAVNRSQEVPAVYAVRNMSKMVIYDGDKPWQNDTLTPILYGPEDKWIWTKQNPTEPWAACVYPETGFGFGLYSPIAANHTWNMGWVGKGAGTEYSSATMHFAPIVQWKLGPQTCKTYSYWIIVGKLEDIRENVYRLHTLYPAG